MPSYTSVHQIYAAGTSVGADNSGNVIVPVAGRIVAISASYSSAAAGGIGRLEVSLQSTNQFTQNDARNVLVSKIAYFAESSGDLEPAVVYMDIPVTEMDRIYMHILQTSAAWRAAVLIYLRHG